MPKNRIHTITAISMMSALICVCSLISIPFTVPITLQIFAIFFAIYYLGGKYATFSVLIYISIGALGMPVFSGFSGGVGRLFDIGGGYITGFLFASLFYMASEKLHFRKTPLCIMISSASALIIIYMIGTAQYVLISGSDIKAALLICVIPFVIPDIIKIALAYYICRMLKKRGK